mgnify:FL=1
MARRWLIVLLVAGVVLMFTAMLLPGAALAWFYNDAHALGRVLIGLDQTAFPFSRWFHMLVFAWLTVCLCALFPRLRYWQVTAILLGLAVAGELVQIPVPGRTAGVGDLVDDLLGIGLGLAVVAVVRRVRPGNAIRRPGPPDQ